MINNIYRVFILSILKKSNNLVIKYQENRLKTFIKV